MPADARVELTIRFGSTDSEPIVLDARNPRRRIAVEAQQPGRRHRDAAARGARIECERLRCADDEGIAQPVVGDPPRAPAAVAPPQQGAEHDERHGDNRRRAEAIVDESLEQGPDCGTRKGRQHEQPRQPSIGRRRPATCSPVGIANVAKKCGI